MVNFLDEEDEFQMKHSQKLYNIIGNVKKYCKRRGLPFFDKNNNYNYSFYDYIKYNCKDWNDIIDNFEERNKLEDSSDSDSEYDN